MLSGKSEYPSLLVAVCILCMCQKNSCTIYIFSYSYANNAFRASISLVEQGGGGNGRHVMTMLERAGLVGMLCVAQSVRGRRRKGRQIWRTIPVLCVLGEESGTPLSPLLSHLLYLFLSLFLSVEMGDRKHQLTYEASMCAFYSKRYEKKKEEKNGKQRWTNIKRQKERKRRQKLSHIICNLRWQPGRKEVPYIMLGGKEGKTNYNLTIVNATCVIVCGGRGRQQAVCHCVASVLLLFLVTAL